MSRGAKLGYIPRPRKSSRSRYEKTTIQSTPDAGGIYADVHSQFNLCYRWSRWHSSAKPLRPQPPTFSASKPRRKISRIWLRLWPQWRVNEAKFFWLASFSQSDSEGIARQHRNRSDDDGDEARCRWCVGACGESFACEERRNAKASVRRQIERQHGQDGECKEPRQGASPAELSGLQEARLTDINLAGHHSPPMRATCLATDGCNGDQIGCGNGR